MLPKLRVFYESHYLPALFQDMPEKAGMASQELFHPVPAIILSDSVCGGAIRRHFLAEPFSQSTLDGCNGSNACTIIACHVSYFLLIGAIPVLSSPDEAVPEHLVSAFVQSMPAANALYGNADLGGQLLAVYEAVDVLSHTNIIVAPRGDLGCHSEGESVRELSRLADVARTEKRTIVGVFVQNPRL